MLLVTFDQVVTQTEATVRRIAVWLGIEFDSILLTPTFNRMPIRANSSFPVPGHGVVREPLDNWRSFLSDAQAAVIDEQTRPLYEEVCALASA
jgi:hypothetical protein